MRYIGSKARVAEAILDVVGEPQPGSVFVDAFCGTGVVAEAASRRGWPIRLNDHLSCAVVMAAARVVSQSQVPFRNLGGYERALDLLNDTEPLTGFIWREYSPASRTKLGFERRYFTETNAMKIDAARAAIGHWRREGSISQSEEWLLLADLLAATNRVANIAGTYGCFLREWAPNSQRDLIVEARDLSGHEACVEVFTGDVAEVPLELSDVVYFDPPYTKRQYAAYYHILETITMGDEPVVGGVTGLRPWQSKASDFCYKVRALRAISEVVSRACAETVALSYSSEGHVQLDALEAELSRLGELVVHDLGEIGRYRPNDGARMAGSAVREFLLLLRKKPALVGALPA